MRLALLQMNCVLKFHTADYEEISGIGFPPQPSKSTARRDKSREWNVSKQKWSREWNVKKWSREWKSRVERPKATKILSCGTSPVFQPSNLGGQDDIKRGRNELNIQISSLLFITLKPRVE